MISFIDLRTALPILGEGSMAWVRAPHRYTNWVDLYPELREAELKGQGTLSPDPCDPLLYWWEEGG